MGQHIAGHVKLLLETSIVKMYCFAGCQLLVNGKVYHIFDLMTNVICSLMLLFQKCCLCRKQSTNALKI